MIAALPMYERAENRAAHDRLWNLFREEYPGECPGRLSRGRDPWEIWQAPDLFLAQTCGLPYRTRLHGRVTLLGAPDHGLDGAPPGHYCSVIVVGHDDPRAELADFTNALWAVNDGLSQSGWAAPVTHLVSLGLPPVSRVLRTGSHRASAGAVAAGRAEIAALDAVSWRLMQRFDDLSGSLRVLGRTATTPGLPFVCAPGRNADAIAAALGRAIARLGAGDRSALGGIRRLVHLDPGAYLALPPAPAIPDDAAIRV